MGETGSKPGKHTVKPSNGDFRIEPQVEALPDPRMSSTSCVEIRDHTGALAQVLPELGGWLVRYQRPIPGHGLVDGVHHDEAVIARYPREMWAGSPLLFPMVSYNHVPGADHHYPWAGKTHPMQPHGFARKTPWKVTTRAADRVELELTDSETTRAVYPFAFRYGLTYRLENGRLHWEQLIENRSLEPMPFSAGFHPYLPIPLSPGSKRSDCVIRCPRATRFNPIGRGEAYFSEPFPEQEFPATVDTGPALLLGDEPTGELDSQTAEIVFNIFHELNRRFALTVIIVSHDPNIAHFVNRVVAIRDGKTSSETYKRPNVSNDTTTPAILEELHMLDSAGRLQIP
ncbi:MAG: hypothetical protein EBU81_14480, partial [Proteobacteria bacterium]|nr:hypothetical protein [Pseudomonadota bacterium]